jgi:hypothetical protein
MDKYQRWYGQIVDRGRKRTLHSVYKERHHIKPRSLGGRDEPSNLVDLTYREHFLVHWLLTKMHNVGPNKHRMVYALHAVSFVNGRRAIAGWQIELAKRAWKDAALGRKAGRSEVKKYYKYLRTRDELVEYLRKFESWLEAGLVLTFDLPDGDKKGREYLEGLRAIVKRPPEPPPFEKLALISRNYNAPWI